MTEPASARLSPDPSRTRGSSRLHELLARADPYLVARMGCMALASLLPPRGAAALALDRATDAAIALLFFLYGARRRATGRGRRARRTLSPERGYHALKPAAPLPAAFRGQAVRGQEQAGAIDLGQH